MLELDKHVYLSLNKYCKGVFGYWSGVVVDGLMCVCIYFMQFFFLFWSFACMCVSGEMIVGPTTALFMDEISTGLDSSTTFQIVKCLSQFCHVMEATILMSLLQPAPETFQLFDDIILLSEGQVVYHGPKENVLEFFRGCGFKCPERKGIADFLQEVRPPPFLLLLLLLPISSISSHIKNKPIKSCA